MGPILEEPHDRLVAGKVGGKLRRLGRISVGGGDG